MAKHMIYPISVPGMDATTRVELQWSRGTDVRIATTKLHPDADRDDEYRIGTSTGEPLLAWEGQFIALDRDQLNHLIRQLREARNQAYGRDE